MQAFQTVFDTWVLQLLLNTIDQFQYDRFTCPLRMAPMEPNYSFLAISASVNGTQKLQRTFWR